MRAGRFSVLPFLLLSAIPFPLIQQPAREAFPVQVVVAGTKVEYPSGQQPYRENGVTMVPVRATLQALGATVASDQQNRTVSGERDCHSVSIREGDATAQVDGFKLTMRSPAKAIGGELYAPLRPLAEGLSAQVVWDPVAQTARVTAPDQTAGRQALLTLTVQRAGTLDSPAAVRGPTGIANVSPGTYRWVVDATGDSDLLTWTFFPADGGPAQTFTLTRTGRRLLASSDTPDIIAQIEQPSVLRSWDYEQAARSQLGKQQGDLTGADLTGISTLTLPAGTDAVSDLCRFPGLSSLTFQDGLTYSTDFLDAAISRVPQLQSLTLKASAELPVDVPLPPADQMPLRVETPHAVFLGDGGLTLHELTRYAIAFEQTAIPELARDTGLQPTRRKVVFQIYGDEKAWNAATASLPVWGYFTGQEDKIYMAHWRTPETINTVLLYHEYFHWLAWEEGHISLPTWLNEGLAHNLSWRVESGKTDLVTPFARRQWLMVMGHPETPIPNLASYQKQDEYTITSVSYLLATRGRDDLLQFFRLTRTGTEFATAFQKSFGIAPDKYLTEYGLHVAEIRSNAG